MLALSTAINTQPIRTQTGTTLARILTIRYREMHVANKAVALDFDAGLRGLHAAYEYLRLRGCSSTPGVNQALYRSLSYDEQVTEIHSAIGAPS